MKERFSCPLLCKGGDLMHLLRNQRFGHSFRSVGDIWLITVILMEGATNQWVTLLPQSDY